MTLFSFQILSGFHKNKLQTGFTKVDPPSPHQARIRVSGDSLQTLRAVPPLASVCKAPNVFVSEYVEEKQSKERTLFVGPCHSSFMHKSHRQSQHRIKSFTCFSSSDMVRGGQVSDRFDGFDFENDTEGL